MWLQRKVAEQLQVDLVRCVRLNKSVHGVNKIIHGCTGL